MLSEHRGPVSKTRLGYFGPYAFPESGMALFCVKEIDCTFELLGIRPRQGPTPASRVYTSAMRIRSFDPRAKNIGTKGLVANVSYQWLTDQNGIFRRGGRPTAERSCQTKVRVCGARPCNFVRPGYGTTRFTVLNPAKMTVNKAS